MRLDRLKENELSKVEEHFREHPLFTACQRAFKRYQANMAPLLFTYCEVFYEAAVIIDHIHGLPQSEEVQNYICDLWNDLRFKLSKWEKTASQENLDMAVSAVLYTVAMAMNRQWTTFYNSDVTRWLLQCIMDNMKVDYQEMTHVFSDFLDLGDGIEKWINNCYENGQSLSEEIGNVITKQHNANVETTESLFVPTTVTFLKASSVLDANITLVFQQLLKNKWIAANSNPDSFISLFSGKPSDKTIVWLKAKGILYDLIKMLIDEGLITCPDGYGFLEIASSHFTDESGNYLRKLNSGYRGKKVQQEISYILVLMKTQYMAQED